MKETDTYEDSFIRTINIQEILWTQIESEINFKIELINPLKAKITKYKRTEYVKFLVQAQEDMENPEIVKDSILYFQFPLKTWEREMMFLSYKKKQKWNSLGEDNMMITFMRGGNSIKFLEIERVKITDEQKDLAVKYYE